jgi:hypothetical protein
MVDVFLPNMEGYITTDALLLEDLSREWLSRVGGGGGGGGKILFWFPEGKY